MLTHWHQFKINFSGQTQQVHSSRQLNMNTVPHLQDQAKTNLCQTWSRSSVTTSTYEFDTQSEFNQKWKYFGNNSHYVQWLSANISKTIKIVVMWVKSKKGQSGLAEWCKATWDKLPNKRTSSQEVQSYCSQWLTKLQLISKISDSGRPNLVLYLSKSFSREVRYMPW